MLHGWLSVSASGAEVTLPDLSEEQEEIDEPEEVTTVNSGKVRVMRDGSIHVVHEGKEGQVTKTAILKFTGRCRTKYVSGDPVKQQKKKEDAKKETKARGDKDKSKRGARSKKEESQEEATKESSDEVETVEVKSLRKRKTAKVSKQKEEASGKEAAAGPKRGKRKATEESDVSPKQKVIKKAVMPKKTPVQKKQAGKKRAKWWILLCKLINDVRMSNLFMMLTCPSTRITCIDVHLFLCENLLGEKIEGTQFTMYVCIEFIVVNKAAAIDNSLEGPVGAGQLVSSFKLKYGSKPPINLPMLD